MAQWLRIHRPVHGTWFYPWSGKIPRATEQLSTCTTTTDARTPQLLSLCAAATEAHAPRAHAPQQEKPPQCESLATARKSSPRSPQLEKACMQQQKPNTAKIKKKKESKHVC